MRRGAAFVAAVLVAAAGAAAAPAADPRDEVRAAYRRDVAPVLAAKCAQCHTDTAERPWLTRVPLLGGPAAAYFEGRIRAGRVQFDFSRGLPDERVGAALEFMMRLRDAADAGAMPPASYRLAHPGSRLSAEERARLAAWARAGLAVYEPLFAAKRAPAFARALTPDALAARVAAELSRLCPSAPTDDAAARRDCGEKLSRSAFLADLMRDPFLWGQETADGGPSLLNSVTARFDPYVWRRLYLSLFLFDGKASAETSGGYVILRVPVRFRGGLDAGDFPYPFWQNPAKWRAYHESADLLFVVKDGLLLGALRSARRGAGDAPAPKRPWDGKWTWTDAHGGVQPQAAFYDRLLSADNPYRADLTAAYQDLALGLNRHECSSCHSPSNAARMKMLEFFNYPNHALDARARLVEVLRRGDMPPAGGMSDAAERARLLAAAEKFRALGDSALDFEAKRRR